MLDRLSARRARWTAAVVTLLVLTLGATAGLSAAGKLEKLDTSLQFVPDDVAFYSASLRNREKFDAVANSRAWAKIKEMPLVQMGLLLYRMQAADPESVPGQIDPFLAVVARGVNSPEDYDLLVKWLKVAYGYFEQ